MRAALVGQSIQLLGIVGSVAALALSLIFGQGYAIFDAAAAAVAIGLDVTALAASPRLGAIAFSLLKPAVSFLPVLVITTGGPGSGLAPLIDPRTGLIVLLWSCIPSVAGAVLRVIAR